MSIFMPEGVGGKSSSGVTSITPSNQETTSDDIALMQRVLRAAAENPNLIPDEYMAYNLDYIQASRLQIPIGQVFGYQRIAPQVIADFGEVPSPVDGQIVMLKVGSASPYIYVQMMYDQGLGQWVSEEFAAGGGAVQTTSTGFVDFGGFAGISWAPVHQKGLTMQLKWSGRIEADVGTPTVQISLVFGNLTTSFTTATMSPASGAVDGTFHPVGVDWAAVTDPGDYNMVAIGMQAKNGGGGTTQASTAVVGRFIK